MLNCFLRKVKESTKNFKLIELPSCSMEKMHLSANKYSFFINGSMLGALSVKHVLVGISVL